MLQDLRDNSKGLIAKVIIGAIASIFVITGWETVGGLIQAPPVAEINGEEITQLQLDQSTQNLVNSVGGGLEGSSYRCGNANEHSNVAETIGSCKAKRSIQSAKVQFIARAIPSLFLK